MVSEMRTGRGWERRECQGESISKKGDNQLSRKPQIFGDVQKRCNFNRLAVFFVSFSERLCAWLIGPRAITNRS